MKRLTYSTREAAKVLGISDRQVRHLVDRDVLAKVPELGRVTRIPIVAVEALVASAMAAPDEGAPTLPPAGVAFGAAGVLGPLAGVAVPAGRSTPETDDGAGPEPDAIEDCGALSTATGA